MNGLLAASLAAVMLALFVSLAPRWGALVLVIVVLLMLSAGVRAGTLAFPDPPPAYRPRA